GPTSNSGGVKEVNSVKASLGISTACRPLEGGPFQGTAGEILRATSEEECKPTSAPFTPFRSDEIPKTQKRSSLLVFIDNITTDHPTVAQHVKRAVSAVVKIKGAKMQTVDPSLYLNSTVKGLSTEHTWTDSEKA
ncbi:unnamed protein product, partial [Choristocarpus tenellus]